MERVFRYKSLLSSSLYMEGGIIGLKPANGSWTNTLSAYVVSELQSARILLWIDFHFAQLKVTN